MQKGFTLIELLIVVAIIGILAAIAVPNFMNAQVKAKLARCVSNMRAVSTALESYYLDQNTYPRWAWDGWGNPAKHYTGFRDLTTPIPYLSGFDACYNPFKAKHAANAIGHNLMDGRELDPYFEMGTYHYNGSGMQQANFSTDTFPKNCWLLESSGPDTGDDYGSQYPKKGLVYQPSNGLYSKGDIFRAGGIVVASWVNELSYK